MSAATDRIHRVALIYCQHTGQDFSSESDDTLRKYCVACGRVWRVGHKCPVRHVTDMRITGTGDSKVVECSCGLSVGPGSQ